MKQESGRIRNFVDLAAAVAMLIAAGAIIWTTMGRQWWQERALVAVPSAPVPLSGLPMEQSGNARIAMLEFADYQCPYCQVFQRETMPTLERQYITPGKVAFAFSQFPIEGLHTLAMDASSVAECANRDGLFWPVHRRLFEVIAKAPDNTVLSAEAARAGLSASSLSACLSTGVQDELRRRVSDAKRLGISSTPTFFLGTIEAGSMLKVRQVLVGTQTTDAFAAALDSLLTRYAASR